MIAKLGFLAKFSLVFVAIGGYALIWGWTFGVGIVVLIFCHEMGHFLEARREGLRPQWPVFIPFLGAYVQYTRGNPWQTTRVAIAGPILGGAAVARLLPGRPRRRLERCSSRWPTSASSSTCSTCCPSGSSTARAVWRSTRWLWLGGGRQKAIVSGVLYGGTAALLALGALAAYMPQTRL